MRLMLRPSSSTGTAAHLLLGIAGGVIALWAGGIWLLGLATVIAGHTAGVLEGLGTRLSGLGAICVAIAVLLVGAVVLVGSPMWGAGLVARGVEGALRRLRHAGRS
jgi:hypothetical protein